MTHPSFSDPFRRHHRKHAAPPDAEPSHAGYGRHGRRGRRPFDYGDLRLLVLSMIADRPRHGYEIIKDISDRFGGGYSPSPGVIYPTLSWLEDMGYIAITPSEAGRKQAQVLPEGAAFLTANHALVTALLARRLPEAGRSAIAMAMDAVKSALLARRDLHDPTAQRATEVAAILHDAAGRIAALPAPSAEKDA